MHCEGNTVKKVCKYLATAFFVLASIVPLQDVRASQASIVGPLSGPKSMAEVMTAVNAAFLAIQSCNSGSSSPTNGPSAAPVAYQMWCDTTTNPAVVKMYDGASWVELGKIDTTSHLWTPSAAGQWVGVPVNAFGALNDGSTNNARYLVDAATYANTNRMGLVFNTGSNYRTTPIQFGGSTSTSGTFTGSISTTTLTVTTTPSKQIAIGQLVSCGGCTADTIVTGYGANTSGWVGTYTVSISQTVGSTTITNTAPQFTASISGTTMAVSAVASGRVTLVDSLVGTSIIPGTTVVSQQTGSTGLTGNYTVSYSQTIAGGTTIRAYPYTVVPIPNFIAGAPGGETQTIILGFGAAAVPQAVIKIVDPPALGAVLGFEIADLRVNANSLYGNAFMFHGFSNTASGGQPRARNLTAFGATASTCGFNFVGNAPGGSNYGIFEAKLSQLSGYSNAVCDFNFDGNNGDTGHYIQGALGERLSGNSIGTGPTFRFNFAEMNCNECLSQNSLGAPIAFDNIYHHVWTDFYSEASGTAITSTANTHGVTMNGTSVSGVDAGLLACVDCNIDLHIGVGLGTYPTNRQRNFGNASGQVLIVNGNATSGTPTMAAGQGFFGANSAAGAQIIGRGSINDFVLYDKNGDPVCTVPTGVIRLNCIGLSANGSTITLGGAFTMSGSFTFTGTLTGTTSITFPTSGTLATTAGAAIPSIATGDLLYGSSANVLSALADVATGNALISGGVGVAPLWGKIGISTHVSGLGTGIATALATNTGSAGAPVLFNGAGGTPSSITLTNGTGLPTTGLTGTLQAAQEPAHTGGVTNIAGSLALTVITNANLTGPITSSGNATSIASQTGTGTQFVMSGGTPVVANLTITSTATFGTDGSTAFFGPAGTTGVNATLVMDGSSGTGVGARFVFRKNSVAKWTLGDLASTTGSGTSANLSLVNDSTGITTLNFSIADDSIAFASTINATSGTVGAINTLGGIGVTKDAWIGGNVVVTGAHIIKGSAPTGTTGTCVASSFTGGTTAGKFAAAVCAGGTIILSGLPTAPNGYTCNAQDQTTPADTLKQTANSTTSATFTATTVAADVIAFQCTAW